MKKIIILTIILSSAFICKSQTRYVLYLDSNYQINSSDTPLPLVAIYGSYNDLLDKPNLSIYLTKTSVPNILSKSTNFTVVDTCFATGKPPVLHIWFDCTSGNLTATLPSYSTFTGYTVVIGKSDATANTLTISGLTFDNVISVQNTCKTLIATPTGWFQN